MGYIRVLVPSLMLLAGVASAQLSVSGDVPSAITVSAEDFAQMPHDTVRIDEEDGTKTSYTGVPIQAILAKAGIPLGHGLRGKGLAAYVLATAKDGYQMIFSMGELDPDFGNAHILVADKRNGAALFGYQGPLRLVVAGDKHGARSVRMLEKLQVVQVRK
jgi:DMSO/TMAO reductase YedYZ molybdopterin-dependent catalytic subunit